MNHGRSAFTEGVASNSTTQLCLFYELSRHWFIVSLSRPLTYYGTIALLNDISQKSIQVISLCYANQQLTFGVCTARRIKWYKKMSVLGDQFMPMNLLKDRSSQCSTGTLKNT